MKIKYLVSILFFPVIISLAVIVFHGWRKYKRHQIKIGQKYTTVLYEDDPFKNIHIDTIEIINLKNNHYQAIEYNYGDTVSGDIDILICCKNRID